MRKFLVLLLLGGASPTLAGIALVQAQSHHYVSVTAQSIAFTNPVATGDVVGVMVAANNCANCGTAPTSVVDSNSDTPINSVPWHQSAGNWSLGVWLFVVGSGSSSFSITVNSLSITYAAIVFDYSGVKASPIDATGSIYTATTASPATGAALTPSQVGDEQLAFLLFPSGSISSWGDSLAQEAANASGSPIAGFADLNLSSTAAVNAGATLGGSQPWGIVQLLLAPAAGGSSCTHAGISQAGAFVVPTAGSTVVRLANGSFGTVNCTSTSYKQQQGAFGVN